MATGQFAAGPTATALAVTSDALRGEFGGQFTYLAYIFLWKLDFAMREISKLSPELPHYLLHTRNGRAEPLNAVARFHLGNGARLDRINWLGDVSARGLAESFGLMANYVYELKDIERNHEAFVNAGTVTASSAVKKLAKSLPGRINTAPTAATTLPEHQR